MDQIESVRIPLWGRGNVVKGYVLVDSDDLDKVGQYRWFKHHNRGYAARTSYENGEHATIFMHRVILGLPAKKGEADVEADHINRDVLDNRKINLRAVTRLQNAQNKRARVDGDHVTWDKERMMWRAKVQFKNRTHNIGRFIMRADAEAAAQAWLEANKERIAA